LSSLIVDGIRFTPWITDDESEFEDYFKQYYKKIFGDKSILFEKKKLTSLAGISSIPDGFVVTFQPQNWYIIEVELAIHDPHKHIVPQINSFLAYIKNSNDRRQLVNAFYNFIRDDDVLEPTVKGWLGKTEIHQFLSDVVFDNPQIVIIIDKQEDRLLEATQIYQPRIIEFKIFQREGVGINVHAVQFEPIVRQIILRPEREIEEKPKQEVVVSVERARRGETTPQTAYTLPILESLIEMGGSGKMRDVLDRVHDKMKNKLTPKDLGKVPSGTAIKWKNTAQWDRQRLKTEGYLKKDSPFGIWEITEEGRKSYEKLKSNTS